MIVFCKIRPVIYDDFLPSSPASPAASPASSYPFLIYIDSSSLYIPLSLDTPAFIPDLLFLA